MPSTLQRSDGHARPSGANRFRKYCVFAGELAKKGFGDKQPRSLTGRANLITTPLYEEFEKCDS